MRFASGKNIEIINIETLREKIALDYYVVNEKFIVILTISTFFSAISVYQFVVR